jgi:ParB-like chromosome segregation protein Spo0J
MAEIADDIYLTELAELIPYSNNAKEHTDEQIKAIASSIKNYGWDQPIVIDADNEVIKGHGRLQAAKVLDLTRVPVIKREDLTPSEVRAARIADNKTAESNWIDDALATEVAVLDESDAIDLDTLGFDDDELSSLISEASLDDDDIAEAFAGLPDGERSEFRQKTFTLAESQVELVDKALQASKDMGGFDYPDNDNSNGNALVRICEMFLETTG